VVSYVPLLRGEAGISLEVGRAIEIFRSVPTDAGHVEAVVWAGDDDGSPWPILVLDRADEVFEHLVEWAEGSPAARFKVAWTTHGNNYALALMPRIDRSVDRYKIARRLISGEDGRGDASFRIVFRPLRFRGPTSAVSRESWLACRLECVSASFLEANCQPIPPTSTFRPCDSAVRSKWKEIEPDTSDVCCASGATGPGGYRGGSRGDWI
jgi:hypothetical protein